MIVNFGLDETALQDDPKDLARLRAVHERFLDLWTRFGVLIYEGNGGVTPNDFVDTKLEVAVRRLPSGIKTLWQNCLEMCRRAPQGKNFTPLSCIQTKIDIDRYKIFKDHPLDLFLLTKSRAHELGLKPGDWSTKISEHSNPLSRV